MKINSPSKKKYLAEKTFKKAERLEKKRLYEQAAREFLKASKLFIDSKNIAACFNNVGFCYYNKNDLINAEKYYQQALVIQKKTLNENNPDIAKSLNNLAGVYKDKNELDKAEEYLQQAKNISEKSPFDDDDFITDNLSKLEQEVTRLERENLEMKAALHQADRLAYLGRMATMMAHNIKNPVNNIATAATSIKMGLKSHKITQEKQLESLDRILNNSERLNQSIEHFRNFAQADTTECTNIDLNKTLEDAYQLLFAGQYQLHNIELTKDYCQSIPSTHSNSFALQEVLTTLLNNAKEALNTQELKKVKISTWKKDDKVGFSIEDNGSGIESEKREQLFTPFSSSKKEGMGLGLYSCKQLIEDSNGTIDYYDAPEGAGFRISLQIATETEDG